MATFHMTVKSGRRGRSVEHAAYITREGKYLRKLKENDLAFHEHGNLPEWAGGSAKKFWSAADKHERANGCAYRELELALPAELDLDQQKAMVEEFVSRVINPKPYQLAIHASTASMAGVPQPHVHLMFSDRMDDGIPRDPAQHFRRYNPRNPELGGCKKDSGGRSPKVLREELVEQRKAWAELINKHLAQHGFDQLVDHRSNRERGIAQEPGRHLGQARIKKLKEEAKTNSIK